MDALLKELGKLEKLSDHTGKGKSPAIADSISGLVNYLSALKTAGQPLDRAAILRQLELKKKDIDDRNREIYLVVGRLGKAIEKKFTTPVPSYPGIFTSEDCFKALDQAVLAHLLRTGQFEAAEALVQESKVAVPNGLRSKFQDMHTVIGALRAGNVFPALDWAHHHRAFLRAQSSPLEFYLHRSQYMRILTQEPPDVQQALAYANIHLIPIFEEHGPEVMRLLACIAFLPLPRLRVSPYADLTLPDVHTRIEPLFAKEFCSSLGLAHRAPLDVVTSIGGGGALAKIEKGRRVLKDSKSGWSKDDELPIELVVPPEHRYHSIFTCPVSKEQSTADNPPMMMECGHVISKDSLHKISKPPGSTGRVKCPYCPNEAFPTTAVQLHL